MGFHYGYVRQIQVPTYHIHIFITPFFVLSVGDNYSFGKTIFRQFLWLFYALNVMGILLRFAVPREIIGVVMKSIAAAVACCISFTHRASTDRCLSHIYRVS
jgi:hypothetical protein